MNKPAHIVRKPDRRKRKTQAALHDAVSALLTEIPPHAFGVASLLDRADVARSTFYMHFDGKDDVMHSFMAGLRSELLESCESTGPQLAGLLLVRCRRHATLFRGLLQRELCSLHLRTWLEDVARELVLRHSPPLDPLVVCARAAAMSSLVIYALRDDDVQPDAVNAVFVGALTREGPKR